MEQPLSMLKERFNLNCPIESLIYLPPVQRHFTF
jgi:hypothetical protein